jgi:uncharacterized protein
MIISGTLLNVCTVLIGGSLGLVVGGRLPERFQSIVMNGLGLSVLVIGMQYALSTKNVLIMLGAILIGGLVGEAMRLSDGLDNLGNYLQRRLEGRGNDSSTFSKAFVTSSLVFCVGPLTILGSIQNGIGDGNDMTSLAVKSLLDGFAAFAFASALGWGVLVSAVTVLVYQGALSVAAHFVAGGVPSHDNPYIVEMTAVGGLIIIGVGLRLLNIKELKLANYLPALAIAPLIVWVLAVWPWK